MFNEFEEWFAIRDGHDDDNIWPGRLSFSPENGVVLEAVRFSSDGDFYQAPDCDTGTITGYLDYQRPTTIINPWVQSQGGGSFGVNTPFILSKVQIIGSAILKNIHLTDVNEECFIGLTMDLPSFNSWYDPEIVSADSKFSRKKGYVEFKVVVDKPEHKKFSLAENIDAEVYVCANKKTEGAVTSLIQQTYLCLKFPEPVDLNSVLEKVWRFNTLFSFFLGHAMAQNPCRLSTTFTRKWNNEAHPLVSELFFRPIFDSKTEHVERHDALFTRQNCKIDVDQLLNCAVEKSRPLFYLMNMVLFMEHSKKFSPNDFSGFIGCIEDFHETLFGSGSSKKRTLRDRLEKMQEDWSDSGFRGAPELKKIVDLRNDISHGRTVSLQGNDYQDLIYLCSYLCALSRFHIFRMLGLSDEDIGKAFRRVCHRYGRYAPSENAGGDRPSDFSFTVN